MSSNLSTTVLHLLELARALVDDSTALSQADHARRARLAETLQALGNALHQVDRHAKSATDSEYVRIGELTRTLLDELDGVLDKRIMERQRRRLDSPAVPDALHALHAELSGSDAEVLAAVENAAGEFAALAIGLREPASG